MATRTRRSKLAVNTAADAEMRLLDGGALHVYSGRQPATADTPVTDQTQLAELRFGAPAFGPAENGVATARAIAPDEDATGGQNPATWCRAVSIGGRVVFDGSVGLAGRDEANLLFRNTTSVQPGSIVRVESLTYTQPTQQKDT